MATTILAGASSTVTIPQNYRLDLTGNCTVTCGPGPLSSQTQVCNSAGSFGPYPRDQVIYINAIGSVSYDLTYTILSPALIPPNTGSSLVGNSSGSVANYSSGYVIPSNIGFYKPWGLRAVQASSALAQTRLMKMVFDAEEGVQSQSETVWRQADKYKVPRICFINKMDKLGANFEGTVEEIKDRLGANPVVMTYPIGQEQEFKGVIDLLEMKALVWDQDAQGTKYTTTDIPEDYKQKAEEWRAKMVEQFR
jgi:hypothetical protein